MKNKKSILLIGGAGYIGSKIAYDLLDRNFKVYIYDNFSSGYKILIPKKATFILGDILDYKKLNNIIKKFNIKNVMHLAALLDISESQKKPKKYYINNVIGTLNILKACNNNFVKNFIFSSTCAVYGDGTFEKSISEKSKIFPKSHYGKSKLICEDLIKQYSKVTGLRYAILRYFNVIGVDFLFRTGNLKNNDQLFNNMLNNISNKKFSINVYGNDYDTKDGTAIRDYISVTDISKIHIESIKKLQNNKTSFIVNCGYGKGFSVLEVIKSFETVLNVKIKINYKKRREGDVIYAVSNTKLFKNIFKNLKLKSDLVSQIKNSILWKNKFLK
jgi:UDP-glucose 4-epimerase